MQSCTIIWEHNYVPPKVQRKATFASVWLFAGDGRHDLERKTPGWVKLMGPVDQELASNACAALKEFFSNNKITVFEDGISD
jgi:hypothetical protein